MNIPRKTVGILFGGQSAEHEISIVSVTAIVRNLDREKFNPVLIYIDKRGQWSQVQEACLLEKQCFPQKGHGFIPWDSGNIGQTGRVDIYFPVLHGPNGEDGKIQSLLELAGKPFVGANSFASALAMDKVVAKILFEKSGLRTPPFLYYLKNDPERIQREIDQNLGYPVFVKPCSLGSSVGISKVTEKKQLKKALDLAFAYDRKVIIEKGLEAREIEIAVMGNQDFQVSQPGEVIPFNDFYDYNDKYLLGKTQFRIPVDLEPSLVNEIQDMAGKAYQALFLNGMSRIDFFLEKNSSQIYINEINTIPGFTEISMFPKLWQAEGIGFSELITRLVEFGFQYFAGNQCRTDSRASTPSGSQEPACTS